jgi:hypothetical protein
MVVDGAGRLHVIDNERMRVDALGFDVGRCWYRWSLPKRRGRHSCAATWIARREAALRLIAMAARGACLRLDSLLGPSRWRGCAARIR